VGFEALAGLLRATTRTAAAAAAAAAIICHGITSTDKVVNYPKEQQHE
jgi:hypothetical protein